MTTIILNNVPYGTELAYNGLRLALALVKKGEQVRVFLLGDGVLCALNNQQTPDGYHNIERMLKSLSKRGQDVFYCGTCADARGASNGLLLPGVERGGMDLLATWTQESDKVITF